jgi:RES domain-containing protein
MSGTVTPKPQPGGSGDGIWEPSPAADPQAWAETLADLQREAEAWEPTEANSLPPEPGPRHGAPDAAASALAGFGGAAGREHYVGAQIAQAERAARRQPPTAFDGDLFRLVEPAHAGTYADHGWSRPGRYNLPGQSALYTSTTEAGVAAEAQNYDGTDNKTLTRSRFRGDLLDLSKTPGLTRGALTQGYGRDGLGRSWLSKAAGEDPYTLPRALADVARARDLSGVIAPANQSTTNVALFPDDPARRRPGGGRLKSGLTPIGHQLYGGATPGAPQDLTRAVMPDDAKPNRSSPARLAPDPADGTPGYRARVVQDIEQHGRISGARYGAFGAGLTDLAEGMARGRTDRKDLGRTAADVGFGGVGGHVETVVGRMTERVLNPPAVPPRVAGAAAGADGGLSSTLRPVGLPAGTIASGVAGGLVGGLTSSGITVWNDAGAVRDGRMQAGEATAAVVSGGVGVASGISGAAAGAGAGSVMPVMGTAAGAAIGFGVGIGAAEVTSWAAAHSGLEDRAEAAIGHFLDSNFEQPLHSAWALAADGVDGIRSGAEAVQSAAHRAWTRVFGLAGRG